MSRLVAVFLAFLTLPAIAATFDPEQRVTPIAAPAAASGDQVGPDVASDGHGFVAVWTDTRTVPSGIYASHILSDGSAEPPAGIRIAEGEAARVASDGNGYLVAYRGGASLYAQHLDANGRPAGDRIAVVTTNGSTPSPLALASNGRSYMLLFDEGNGLEWLFLDAAGRPVSTPKAIDATYSPIRAVATSDGIYHVIFYTTVCPVTPPGCVSKLVDESIDDRSGSTSAVDLLPLGNHDTDILAAASGGTEIVVVFGEGGIVYGQTFTGNGFAISQRRALPLAYERYNTVVSAGFDGTNFIAISGTTTMMQGVRIGRNGELLDSAPFTISQTRAGATLAYSGTRAAMVYAAGTATGPAVPAAYDIFERVVTDFAELVAPGTPAQLLALTPPAQRTPAAAFTNGQLITVWREGDGNGSIVASAGGQRILISSDNGQRQHDPGVAASGNSVLFAWRSDAPGHRRILASLLRLDGVVLHAGVTFVLDDDTTPDVRVARRDRVSIATSGHEFFVAWPGGSFVKAKRVGLNGNVLDAAPIQASQAFGTYYASAITAVYAGGVYASVFTNELFWPFGAPPPPPSVDLYLSRVTTAGVALDATQTPHLYHRLGYWDDVTAAAWGDRVFIAWIEASDDDNVTIHLQSIEDTVSAAIAGGASVTTLDTVSDSRMNLGFFNAAAAAHAGRFAVIWTLGPLSANGTRVVIAGSSPIAFPSSDVYDVAATGSSNGFTFVYSRRDSEASDVPQLFSRNLPVTAARSRAVR